MHHALFALPEALVQEAEAVAQAEQTSLDAFIWTAMREKIAAARTAQSFRTHVARANPQAFLAVLERIKQAAGPMVAGDERGVGPPLPLRAAGSRAPARAAPCRCPGRPRRLRPSRRQCLLLRSCPHRLGKTARPDGRTAAASGASASCL
jgi:hypothetical protein